MMQLQRLQKEEQTAKQTSNRREKKSQGLVLPFTNYSLSKSITERLKSEAF